MSEATVTVVSGVLVLVIGQILQRFLLEPIFEQRRIVGEIARVITFHANFTGEGREVEDIREVKYEIRALASSLRASMWTIPFYRLWATLGLVTRRKAVIKASASLIGWSNTIPNGRDESREEHQTKVRDALNLQWE